MHLNCQTPVLAPTKAKGLGVDFVESQSQQSQQVLNNQGKIICILDSKELDMPEADGQSADDAVEVKVSVEEEFKKKTESRIRIFSPPLM